MTVFSVADEIRRVAQAELESVKDPTVGRADLSLAGWDQIAKNLARLGKQQLRANQQLEAVTQETREALKALRGALEAATTEADQYRRESIRLREAARSAARKVLAVIDSLDDVGILARQRGDAQWLKYVDRLTRDTMAILQSIGLTEIPAAGQSFDPEQHEALDTVQASPQHKQFDVVEVVQRGFRYEGHVLRRAQVITAR